MATYEQREQIFRQIDDNNSGYFTMEEAKEYFSKMENKPANLESLFERTDASGDGLISFDEFMEFSGYFLSNTHRGESIRRVFFEMDTQNTGKIHYSKIDEVLGQIKRNFYPEELEAIKENAMLMQDSEGNIVCEEFLTKLMSENIIIIEDLVTTGGRYSIGKRKKETEAPSRSDNKVLYSMHYWPENNTRTLAILGDIPELGAWDPSKAVLAEEFENTGWWTVNIRKEVPEGKVFQWKWVVVDQYRPGVLRWESGEDRVGMVGSGDAKLWFPWMD